MTCVQLESKCLLQLLLGGLLLLMECERRVVVFSPMFCSWSHVDGIWRKFFFCFRFLVLDLICRIYNTATLKTDSFLEITIPNTVISNYLCRERPTTSPTTQPNDQPTYMWSISEARRVYVFRILSLQTLHILTFGWTDGTRVHFPV